MTVSVPHARRLRMSTVLVCAFVGAGASMFGQSRDLNAERFLMDDNGSDGTRHTLTLQVPPAGLSANRTLTFPDGDGTVLTLDGELTEGQILFGGAGEQVGQSALFQWDNSTSIFSIGAGPLFSVDGTTGNTAVGGTLDAQAAGNTIGDGTDAEQLEVQGVDGGAVEVDINGDADVSGTLSVGTLVLNGDLDMNDNDIFDIDELRGNSTTGDLNVNTTNTGDVNIGNGSGEINTNGTVNTTGSIIPTADDTYSLGTDDNRFSDLFVNGGSVHVGESGGEVSGSEMSLGFVGIVGEINILGGNPEQIFNGDAVEIQFDANGDGTIEVAVDGAGLRINSDVGTNALLREDGISRNGGGVETFTFSNSGGDLDVNIDGDLDVDIDLNVDGNTVHVGTLDQQGAVSNTTGDVVVNDDANVTGSLDVDTDLNVDGNTVHVGTLDQQGAVSNTTGDVVVNDDANVTGSLDVDTDLNVDGNTVHVGTLDQQGAVSNSTGDVVLNDDANVTGSLDVDTDLNVDGASTLVGTLDAQAAGNTIGDGTDAEQLEVQGVDGGAVEVDINGDADVSGTLSVGTLVLNGDLDMNDNDIFDIDELRGNSTTGDLNVNTTNTGDVNIGNGSGEINTNGTVNTAGSIIPTADDTYSLGTDDNRFSDLFVNGGSVHVGESGGEVSGSEMSLGFVGIVGEINILGGNPEQIFNGDAVEIQFDANGDGTIEVAVDGAGLRINSDVGTNALLREDGISRNGGGVETFTFSNSGGDLDVTVQGDLDVDANLNVDGTSTLVGAFDAQAAGNTIGDGTDAEQLEVQGVDGGAVEVDINGDADVSGTLTVGTLAVSNDLDMNQNDIVDLGNIEFSTAGSNLSNTAGDVTVNDNVAVTGTSDLQGAVSNTTGDVVLNDDANVTGSLDVDTDLNVDGNTVHVGTLDQQGAISSSTGDVVVNDDANVTGSLDVDTDLNVDGNTVHVGTLDQQGAVSNTTGNVTVNDDVDVSGAVQIGGATAVTNSRLVIDDGHWTSQQTTAPVSAAAGANVTSAILSNATDVAGFLDITSSGTPLAGAQATVTFDTPYATAPMVVMMPANGSAVGVGAYVTRTTTGFTVNFIGVPAASTSHQFYYQVIETQ